MKNLKIFGLTLFSAAMMLSTAMGVNAAETDVYYTNTKGVALTEEQYNTIVDRFGDKIVTTLSQKYVDILSDLNYEFKTVDEYSITTDTIDKNGKVVNSVTISATKEEAEAITKNKNLHVFSDKKLHDTTKENTLSTYAVANDYQYSTSSKRVRLCYTLYGSNVSGIVIADVLWYKTPNVKTYDVLAVRWDESMPLSNISDYSAYQYSDVGTTEYTLDGTNMVRTTYGIGQTMNLYDAGTEFEFTMMFSFNNLMGDYAYATYQHSTYSYISLAQSKSYTFGSSGLGGVLVYNPSSIANYYDNMTGVKDNYQSGLHFEI